MYVNIAMGSYDRASLTLLSLFSGLLSGILTGFSLMGVAYLRKVKRSRESVKDKIEGLDDQGSVDYKSKKEKMLLEIENMEPKLRLLDRLVYPLFLVLLLILTFILPRYCVFPMLMLLWFILSKLSLLLVHT